jgi:CheY-like chemotaxis protein
MRLYLTHRGYRVVHAQNGFEAIETAGSEIPDLVVTDVMVQRHGRSANRLGAAKRRENTSHSNPRIEGVKIVEITKGRKKFPAW